MLAILGTIGFTVFAFLVTALASEYDKLVNAIGVGFLTLLGSGFLLGGVIPAIATSETEIWDTRNVHSVSELSAEIVGDTGTVELTWYNEDGRKETVSTSDDYFSISRRNDIDTPQVQERCDITPSWAAPWNMGSCTEELVLPKDYVLELT